MSDISIGRVATLWLEVANYLVQIDNGSHPTALYSLSLRL